MEAAAAGGKSSDHIIDVENVTSCMEKELENIRPKSNKFCIYRVPKRLRKGNEEVFTPQGVSIGPYHHGKQELREMEECKKIYLKHFLQLGNVSIKACLDLIIANETRLRDSYEEEIEFSSHDFVKMILLDAAFLVMLLVLTTKSSIINYNQAADRMFWNPGKLLDIDRDLAMLENQIPFFIVKELFELSKISEILQGVSIFELTHDFLHDRWPTWVTEIELNLGELDFSQVNHIVDFLRIYHVPLQPYRILDKMELNAPSIKELYQAGVKFRCGSSNKLLDIKFNGDVLEIPSLTVRASSETLFRNVMGFEQLHYVDCYINDYIGIISKLVRTSEDVELLARERILVDAIDDTEALLSLFHGLKRRVLFYSSRFYFGDVSEQLGDYCKKPWHKWTATLKQDYFNTPWSGVSVIAAVILLLLTLLQTICSVLDQATH